MSHTTERKRSEKCQPFVGIVGAGYWGKNLLRDLYTLGVLGIACDKSEEIRKITTEKYPDLPFTTNIDDLLHRSQITAIVIALPAELHYHFTKLCLEAGKDVFVEKPLALNVQQAEELCQIAEANEKILMVGHLLQYHPCVEKIKEIVSSGGIGTLRYIHCVRRNLGKIRQQENVLWSFAPHDISVVLALMNNTQPINVQCVGQKHLHPDIHDVTDTFLEFPGNCFAHIAVNWLYPEKEQKMSIVGSKGMLVFDDTKKVGEKLKIRDEYLSHSPGSIPIANKKPFQYVKCDWGNGEFPLYRECKYFVECCLKRRQPLTDGQEGLRVLRILDSCQEQLLGSNGNGNGNGNSNGNGNNHHKKEKQTKFYLHPTAIVEKGAKIGKGTKIWHYSHLMKTKLGENCSIGQNCFLANGSVLGNNCRVQNNVSVYDGVVCGNNVFLGPSMVFCNDKNPRAAVSKNGNYMKTFVKDGVSIGSNATILPGITLNEHCFIGAGAVVTKDVEPYAVMVGNPARKVGYMDENGTMVESPP